MAGEQHYDLIVIGGGAAGFFGAVQVAEMKKGTSILILEKSNKVLAKVKVSGGGRCNVTHHCEEPFDLARHYPRGEKPLKKIFKKFDAVETIKWFAKEGVSLKVEEDGRMFPTTDDSQTIIDALMNAALRNKVAIKMGEGVVDANFHNDKFQVTCNSQKSYFGSRLLICIGGSPNTHSYSWIEALGHKIVKPIPSLFTFNDSEKKFVDLMGLSVPRAEVRIASTKFSNEGPLLITHWGLSGPAVIKLSAWAAEYLHQVGYDFMVLVSWVGPFTEENMRGELNTFRKTKAKQKIFTNPQFGLPQRLWTRLCELAEIEDSKIWSELAMKNQNRLMELLIRCSFRIRGKTTFKEEFVTCGGVDLNEVDLERMESKKVKGVFFAGEVLNIDGETGGFNFQSAWSTGWVAAKAISS